MLEKDQQVQDVAWTADEEKRGDQGGGFQTVEKNERGVADGVVAVVVEHET